MCCLTTFLTSCNLQESMGIHYTIPFFLYTLNSLALLPELLDLAASGLHTICIQHPIPAANELMIHNLQFIWHLTKCRVSLQNTITNTFC